jgi:murein DD-endopeptidase MepM/ murein hydrolase activator NlpD
MRSVFASLILVLALSGCAAPAPAVQTPLSLPTVSATQVPVETSVRILVKTLLPAAKTSVVTANPSPAGTSPAETSCAASETTCVLPGHFLFRRPLDPSTNDTIDQTYAYGATQDGKREPHHGVDFPNAQGTPVLAAGDGVVVVAGDDKLALYGWVTSFYGNLVVIEHRLPGFDETFYTLYGHLFEVSVRVGQNVKAGDQIGKVGSTGIAIGSHLHFEVRVNKNDYKSTRNPDLWMKPLPGTGVLAGRVIDAQGNLVRATVMIQRVVKDTLSPLYPIETYPRESLNADDALHENFAVGELQVGEYRLTLIYNGKIYEEHVQITPGKLTLVIFSVN